MGLPTKDNIYAYNAHIAPAVAFTVLYSVWSIWHAYLCIYRARHSTYKHRYTIPLLVAALLSTAGYGVRIPSIQKPSSVALYASSASYIVIAPIFVCATLYLLLTRLIRLTLPIEDQKVYGVPPRWLGRVFIGSDITSFLMQCAGSGIASSGNWQGSLLHAGVDILLGGLGLQLGTFTVFLLFLWRFVTRVNNSNATGFNPSIRKVLIGVWIASAFVQIRTIYRMIEFALGIKGYPFSNEWCLFVFEATPMWIALGVLGWCHPVRWLQQKPRYETLETKSDVESRGRMRTEGNQEQVN